MPRYVDGTRSRLSFHDAEFNCLTFPSAPLDVTQVIRSYRCLVNEDALTGAVAV